MIPVIVWLHLNNTSNCFWKIIMFNYIFDHFFFQELGIGITFNISSSLVEFRSDKQSSMIIHKNQVHTIASLHTMLATYSSKVDYVNIAVVFQLFSSETLFSNGTYTRVVATYTISYFLALKNHRRSRYLESTGLSFTW